MCASVPLKGLPVPMPFFDTAIHFLGFEPRRACERLPL
jgi:hypothetical protein